MKALKRRGFPSIPDLLKLAELDEYDDGDGESTESASETESASSPAVSEVQAISSSEDEDDDCVILTVKQGDGTGITRFSSPPESPSYSNQGDRYMPPAVECTEDGPSWSRRPRKQPSPRRLAHFDEINKDFDDHDQPKRRKVCKISSLL